MEPSARETRTPIDPDAPDAEPRLRALLAELKSAAREVEPDNWWLQATTLTDLGYVRLVLQVATVLKQAHGTTQGVRVLDWGGGPGYLSYLLENLGFSTYYYDFDFRTQFPSFDLALRRLSGDIRFVDDEVVMPYEDRSFEAVVSFGVLERVPNPAGSLGEINRVLVDAGKLFVFHFPNSRGYIENVARRMGRPVHDLRWSRQDLTRSLADAGFELESFEYRYLLPRNLTDWPRARGFIDAHAQGFYGFDAALTKVPGLNSLATTLNAVATKVRAPAS